MSDQRLRSAPELCRDCAHLQSLYTNDRRQRWKHSCGHYGDDRIEYVSQICEFNIPYSQLLGDYPRLLQYDKEQGYVLSGRA